MFESYINLTFEEGYKGILELALSQEKIVNQDIILLFTIEEKELISAFLGNFNGFSRSNLKIIEKKINTLLYNDNREYVSDLIDFSILYGLNLDYTIIINLVKQSDKKEHFVILSALQYLSENIKYYYIEEIFESLELIVDSKHSDNIKILSLLILYKISHLDIYVDKIKKMIDNEQNLVYYTNRINNYDFDIKLFNNKKLFSLLD
ncbi:MULTISPECIES: hypothetical protein [Myroides]|uniref:Uncharacterized protein n=1 Tax=Myroides odoratus TaxID=256 RepID=A0A9Q6Z3R5_MYROD|nr:hypothetical protein [Myroides odoratus]EHQ41280.1 hypothetical protein Myrod_0443 [Myroides odoratus DSM 2801]QQT98720.1 hypothetical protein I6I88_10865 [Myroides odoratus]WQD59101.1 hypothetical protein U0010_08110 [Myroides odoratus]STZ32319.1 Uncharacterised protein [Myroides odoratus]